MSSATESGVVVESYGRRVVVARAEGERVTCKVRGRRLEVVAGDLVRIEVLGDIDNYRSNVTRTAVVGKPTDRQKKIWAGLMAARDDCKTMLKPGTAVADVYRNYVRICRSHDIDNLFVVDASFFPSSAAVNPGLTIIAQALRVAEHIAATEVRARSSVPHLLKSVEN